MGVCQKLYIFDLDGTLLNTIGDLAAAANFALQKNGLPPRTLADVQTAVNAGLPCLSVSWGFRSRDFLLASGARRIADRPEEIGQAGFCKSKPLGLPGGNRVGRIL